MDTDHSIMITRRKGGKGRVEEGIGGMNDDGRRLTWSGEHTVQHTDNLL